MIAHVIKKMIHIYKIMKFVIHYYFYYNKNKPGNRMIKRIPKNTLFICVISSSLFCQDPEDFILNGVIINELSTNEYLNIIKIFLPHNPIVLEAGCHGGQDTVAIGNMWPEGKIYAFDPVEKFVDFTNAELEKHNIKNARVYQLALSRTSGQQTFYYSTACGGASSLLPSNLEMKEICDYQDITMTANCMNLDEWAQKENVTYIDFMWLDMEGSELEVLSSSPQILKTVKVIITEINFREFRQGTTRYEDLATFLKSNGFTLYKIWGSPTWQGTALFIRSELVHEESV